MGEVPSPISAVRGDPKTALAPQFWGTWTPVPPRIGGLGGRKIIHAGSLLFTVH